MNENFSTIRPSDEVTRKLFIYDQHFSITTVLNFLTQDKRGYRLSHTGPTSGK